MDMPLLPVLIKEKRKRPYRGDNAFGILGVHPDAPTEEITRAYRRLARKYHPDINPSPEARQQFLKINRAYGFIMKEGELARLQLKCRMVEIKRTYVGLLEIIKREHELGGIPVEPPDPSPQHFSRQSEQDVRMQELSACMSWDCPRCQWRDKCGRATGFDQVEELHHEIQSKVMAKTFAFFFGK